MCSRSWLGLGAFLTFVVAQISDGVFTYFGVVALGLRIEANPLIVWYVSNFGLLTALIAIKVFAVTCGAALYVTSRHRALGVLTLAYAAVALWPWTRVLASL